MVFSIASRTGMIYNDSAGGHVVGLIWYERGHVVGLIWYERGHVVGLVWYERGRVFELIH
jgi:hypothetical protein